jgi:hypothetical protein
MDSDVIKQYVALGMGVGIVASMAFDHGRDKGMRAVEASHLFARTPRGWRCAAAPICARTPTTSSSNLRPI